MSKYSELFQRLDKDGNGAITKDELREGLTELNMEVDDSKIDSFYSRVDINGDGKITMPEFEAFINAHNPENADLMEFLHAMNGSLPALKKMSSLNNLPTVDREVRLPPIFN